MKGIKDLINHILDSIYIPFSKVVNIPKSTFRYAACGGANTTLDIFLYFIFYNFVIQKRFINLKVIVLSPHIAAFILAFCITFPTGFLLNKYITFTQSELKGRIQLFRYGLVVAGTMLFNYAFLKFFVEFCEFYPTPSKILATALGVVISYLSQKNYSFKH